MHLAPQPIDWPGTGASRGRPGDGYAIVLEERDGRRHVIEDGFDSETDAIASMAKSQNAPTWEVENYLRFEERWRIGHGQYLHLLAPGEVRP